MAHDSGSPGFVDFGGRAASPRGHAMTKRLPNINAPGALGIYDGQQRAGTVIRQNGEFFAFDAEGNCLGVFDTMLEASRKIPPVRREAAQR
jgi:hypothetical protein